MDILTDALVVAPLVETMELFAKAAMLRDVKRKTNSDFDSNPNHHESSFPTSGYISRVFFYVFQNQVCFKLVNI